MRRIRKRSQDHEREVCFGVLVGLKDMQVIKPTQVTSRKCGLGKYF